MVDLDMVVGVLSVQCHAAGSSSLSTDGYTGAWSVATSTGVTRIWAELHAYIRAA
jgi:hypothetical protein